MLATHEAVDIDTNDPMVFMQRSMSYMFANSELLRIRKRTRDGMRQAQSSGRCVSGAPFGYRNAKDGDNKSMLLVDEDKAPVVQQIFREYLAGTPVFELLKRQGRKDLKIQATVRYPGYLVTASTLD